MFSIKTLCVAALALAACGSDLDIQPKSLPNGAVGLPYHELLSSTGQTPIHWQVASGDVPTGVSLLSDGTLDGTPETAGPFAFTIESTESGTLHSNSGTQSYTLTVLAKLVPQQTVPDAQAGQHYAQTISATGGVAPYTIQVKGLPAHFSFDASSNTLTGDPTLSGSYTLEIDVTDSGSPQQTAVVTPTLTIKPPKVVVTTTTLPSAELNVAYTATLADMNGNGPFEWSVVAGALPDGLDLTPDTGVIAGTPTTSATFIFTVQVADLGSPPDTATQQLSITVQ